MVEVSGTAEPGAQRRGAGWGGWWNWYLYIMYWVSERCWNGWSWVLSDKHARMLNNNTAVQPCLLNPRASTGAFISLTTPKAPKTPSNTSLHHDHPPPILSPKNFRYSYPKQSPTSPFLSSADTSISSTQIPNTSLPITIADAIRSSKSYVTRCQPSGI